MKPFLPSSILFCLILVLLMEGVEIALIKKQSNGSEDSFLPMVYENQIYQSISTDGCVIYNDNFLQSCKSQLPILVLRYSGLSCRSCVQACMNGLRRHWPDYENNSRIMVVVSEVPNDDGSSRSVVLGDNETLGYDLEGTRIPHFFVYDPVSQSIFHTFVPDQSDLNAIQIYLSTVLSRYRI